MEFKTTLCTPNPDWSEIRHTAKEAQQTDYKREDNLQIVTPQFDDLIFREEIENTGKGTARVQVEVKSEADTTIGGVFFCLEFPQQKVAEGGNLKITSQQGRRIAIGDDGSSAFITERGVERVTASLKDMKLQVEVDKPTKIMVDTRPEDGSPVLKVYFALIDGNVRIGQKASNTFSLQVEGEVDREPILLALDTDNPGREFMGMGGNFRLQNARTDPQVIDYNLKNMRIDYGRVEMPWGKWHPVEDENPIAEAEAGNLNPDVHAAMEMARRLHNMGMPISLATWFPPQWAVIGEITRGVGADGKRGNQLLPDKMEQIYKSIGDYIWYLKKHYGVEAAAFSFNESDLGIDVRQTAEEHREFIKGMGEHLAKRDLKTKLYLGDTADANGYEFTYPAMNDPETHKYISAVSFHSWRGWEKETLQQWRDISTELNIPVIIGEGSTDAAAWRYNEIFDEPTFAMHEINLYLRILGITQAKTILQWQLTADYSLLKGGGVFGNLDEELQPMQRFWNLKQLASTPKNSFHLEVSNNSESVTSTGLGDISTGKYTVHVVNDGAERKATLTGLPENVEELYVFVTDQNSGMEQLERVPVHGGEAVFTAKAWSFTSLFSAPIEVN